MPEITLRLEDHHLTTLDGLADVWRCSHDEAIRRLLATHGERMVVADDYPPIIKLRRLESRLDQVERQQDHLLRKGGLSQENPESEAEELLKKVAKAAPDKLDEGDHDRGE